MQTVQFFNSSSNVDRSPLELFVISAIAHEYQFEVIVGKQRALITFHKGNWNILIKGDDYYIDLCDSGEVKAWDVGSDFRENTTSSQLAKGFVEEASEKTWAILCQEDCYNGRIPYAAKIWRYLELRLKLTEARSVDIYVHQNGRNGWITEGEIECGVKDW